MKKTNQKNMYFAASGLVLGLIVGYFYGKHKSKKFEVKLNAVGNTRQGGGASSVKSTSGGSTDMPGSGCESQSNSRDCQQYQGCGWSVVSGCYDR